MHLCWCMPHECIPTETRRVHWIISANHGFKSQLSADMGAWARERLCIYLGKTLPSHGLEALMSFVMAVLMSVIFRAPWLPTNNKNSGCDSGSSNPDSSSGTSRYRAASGVIVAEAVIIMVPSQE